MDIVVKNMMKITAVPLKTEVLPAPTALPRKMQQKSRRKASKERTNWNMTKNKKRIAFIAILFCIVMMCSACSATNTDKVNEQAIANEQAALNEQIVKICEDYGLENITVELSRYKDYGNYYCCAEIHCDRFASLDSESATDLFNDILKIDSGLGYLLAKDITVYSDSKVYTAEWKSINGKRITVVCTDSTPMNPKYDDSNKKECSSCRGRGSIKCTQCNGTGKIGLRTFDGWEMSVSSSYDCPYCKRQGRITCAKCHGDGYYYPGV